MSSNKTASNKNASNKSGNNSKTRSKPTPVTRKRLQAMALSGNPLQSISSNGNRQQSRNNRLLKNVQEIKGNCSFFRDKLGKMERMLELKEYPHVEELKSEIDALKSVIEKCNEEKKEKDKIIKKLNKELEREKEEGKDYPLLMSRFKNLYVKYGDNQKLLDESHASNKLLKSKIKELEKNSMNMPATSEELENKVTNYKELYLLAQEELDALRKRDEIRTRMLTEDLRAFEEKRQEILLAIDTRQRDGIFLKERPSGVEQDKLHYTSTVIDHLKMVLYGISPIDLCWIKYADESLEGAERSLRTWGKTIHPYKVQYKTDTFFTDVTREEFIDSIKKGKTTTLPTYIEEHYNCLDILKQNLLIKTIDWLGRYHG